MTVELTKKIIEGLSNYNLTPEIIADNGWHYCGGNSGRHLNYFKLCFPLKKLPTWTNKCICGHDISENCYITDDDEILVLGNCCIKKFVPKSTRTCEICKEPHKNRIVNKCNSCRKGVCDECGKTCNDKYKKCYDCFK